MDVVYYPSPSPGIVHHWKNSIPYPVILVFSSMLLRLAQCDSRNTIHHLVDVRGGCCNAWSGETETTYLAPLHMTTVVYSARESRFGSTVDSQITPNNANMVYGFIVMHSTTYDTLRILQSSLHLRAILRQAGGILKNTLVCQDEMKTRTIPLVSLCREIIIIF